MKICSVHLCSKKSRARGFCNTHYQRWVAHKDPSVTKKPRYLISDHESVKKMLLSYRKITEQGCWDWTGFTARGGYGRVRVQKKDYTVSRLSAMVFLNFDISSDLCICHHCDRPICFNPDHLFEGTHKENGADSVNKDRHCRGERSGNSKLNQNIVLEILERIKQGESNPSIAKIYNISKSTVSNIKCGSRWKHLSQSYVSQ